MPILAMRTISSTAISASNTASITTKTTKSTRSTPRPAAPRPACSANRAMLIGSFHSPARIPPSLFYPSRVGAQPDLPTKSRSPDIEPRPATGGGTDQRLPLPHPRRLYRRGGDARPEGITGTVSIRTQTQKHLSPGRIRWDRGARLISAPITARVLRPGWVTLGGGSPARDNNSIIRAPYCKTEVTALKIHEDFTCALCRKSSSSS